MMPNCRFLRGLWGVAFVLATLLPNVDLQADDFTITATADQITLNQADVQVNGAPSDNVSLNWTIYNSADAQISTGWQPPDFSTTPTSFSYNNSNAPGTLGSYTFDVLGMGDKHNHAATATGLAVRPPGGSYTITLGAPYQDQSDQDPNRWYVSVTVTPTNSFKGKINVAYIAYYPGDDHKKHHATPFPRLGARPVIDATAATPVLYTDLVRVQIPANMPNGKKIQFGVVAWETVRNPGHPDENQYVNIPP